MRLIDADALSGEVDKSKHNNPHSQGLVRMNHRNEHDHFLRMIYDAPTVDAVVLPCMLGNRVFQTDGIKIYESTVNEITLTTRRTIFVTENIAFDERAIGKTVFLTREEAERMMNDA